MQSQSESQPTSGKLFAQITRTPSFQPRLATARHLRGHDQPAVREWHAFGIDSVEWHHERITGLRITARGWISHHVRLLQDFPDLTTIRLRLVRPYVSELAKSRSFDRLTGIDIADNDLTADSVTTLAQAIPTESVRTLNLAGNRLTAPDIERLLADFGWTRLESLDLTGNDTSGIAVRNWRLPTTLRDLRLNRTQLQHLPTLPAGLFECSAAENPSLQVADESRFWASLADRAWQKLDLAGCDLGGQSADWLRLLPESKGVRHLRLSQNRLNADELVAFAQFGWFTACESLDLAGNPMGPFGFQAVREAIVPSRCRRLDLQRIELTDWALHAWIAASRAAPAAESLESLESLSLAWNPLSEKSLRAFCESGLAPNLRELDLSGITMSLPLIEALVRRSECARLERLILRDCPRLRETGIARLRNRFGENVQF
ncbi:leucine-rich repeat domain-containing protein [Tuwongella immobilis]|uniref:: LRR_7: LRR_6 n=1 Tax=Tuwongella immobilis TaxID=692036 RepID=A0A6C2YMA1_9BACT|nr:hypothetical protein [Tuwongella immobilis]VIP02487.1 : LRR_7: LRR_6 [Tuwongella immobilis]VTS01547.1 : LRR_7: LRR_6 [Tuwongella immobilis]